MPQKVVALPVARDPRAVSVEDRPPTIFERDGRPEATAAKDEEAERRRAELLHRESNLQPILDVLARQFVATAYEPDVSLRLFGSYDIDAAVEDAIDNVKDGLEALHLTRGAAGADQSEGALSPRDGVAAAPYAEQVDAVQVDQSQDGDQGPSQADFLRAKESVIQHFVASALDVCREHCKPFTHPERSYFKKVMLEKDRAQMELSRKLETSNRRLKELREKLDGTPPSTPAMGASRRPSHQLDETSHMSPDGPVFRRPSDVDMDGDADIRGSPAPGSFARQPRSGSRASGADAALLKAAAAKKAAGRVAQQQKLALAKKRHGVMMQRLAACERERLFEHDFDADVPQDAATLRSHASSSVARSPTDGGSRAFGAVPGTCERNGRRRTVHVSEPLAFVPAKPLSANAAALKQHIAQLPQAVAKDVAGFVDGMIAQMQQQERLQAMRESRAPAAAAAEEAAADPVPDRSAQVELSSASSKKRTPAAAPKTGTSASPKPASRQSREGKNSTAQTPPPRSRTPAKTSDSTKKPKKPVYEPTPKPTAPALATQRRPPVEADVDETAPVDAGVPVVAPPSTRTVAPQQHQQFADHGVGSARASVADQDVQTSRRNTPPPSTTADSFSRAQATAPLHSSVCSVITVERGSSALHLAATSADARVGQSRAGSAVASESSASTTGAPLHGQATEPAAQLTSLRLRQASTTQTDRVYSFCKSVQTRALAAGPVALALALADAATQTETAAAASVMESACRDSTKGTVFSSDPATLVPRTAAQEIATVGSDDDGTPGRFSVHGNSAAHLGKMRASTSSQSRRPARVLAGCAHEAEPVVEGGGLFPHRSPRALLPLLGAGGQRHSAATGIEAIRPTAGTPTPHGAFPQRRPPLGKQPARAASTNPGRRPEPVPWSEFAASHTDFSL